MHVSFPSGSTIVPLQHRRTRGGGSATISKPVWVTHRVLLRHQQFPEPTTALFRLGVAFVALTKVVTHLRPSSFQMLLFFVCLFPFFPAVGVGVKGGVCYFTQRTCLCASPKQHQVPLAEEVRGVRFGHAEHSWAALREAQLLCAEGDVTAPGPGLVTHHRCGSSGSQDPAIVPQSWATHSGNFCTAPQNQQFKKEKGRRQGERTGNRRQDGGQPPFQPQGL